MMTQRSKILLLLALMASIPFGLMRWRQSLPCKIVQNTSSSGNEVVLVPDVSGYGTLPCPVEDPSRISTSIVVLTWITFCSASVYFGMIDAADYFASLRQGDGEDALLKS